MTDKSKVSIFAQCLVDAMYPEIGDAMVNIFQRLDIPWDCPKNQTCCGQPAYNSGYFSEARIAARHFIRVFEASDQIVCPSGSCVHMVRHHYPRLFENNRKWHVRASRVAQKTYELSEYLVDICGIKDLDARYDGKVTVHDSCHALRGLGIQKQPRLLINHLYGSELIEMKESDRCCGFGGTFSVKYPEISTAMAEDKVQNVIDSGADTVTGIDISCLMNIEGILSRRKSAIKVIHLANLLAGFTGQDRAKGRR